MYSYDSSLYCAQLEIDRSVVHCSYIDKSVAKFDFEILLRDKFPFQPPFIITKTKVTSTIIQLFCFQFTFPSLADGRDLLTHIIPKTEEDWRPSMNLQDLILRIPEFIVSVATKLHKGQDKDPKTGKIESFGRFHLGLQYDTNIWTGNPYCLFY